VDDSRRGELEAERDSLILAASDMRQAAAGARYLVANPRMNSDAARALWTGVVVCYARPFTKSLSYPKLGNKTWAPKDPVERRVHANLLRFRRQVFAHNDATEMREVIDFATVVGALGGVRVEQHLPIPPRGWEWVAKVADGQAKRMKERSDAIAAELAAG
jgi:hypothetical protein